MVKAFAGLPDRRLGLLLMVEYFPTVIGGNWSFFTETLPLSGQGSELGTGRGIIRCRISWAPSAKGYLLTGHGIGMSSLGMQYVSRFLS